MANGRPETVTVLFSDLVGSTAWRIRVGDAVADRRTAELERASREIVETSGGTVVKGVGDGVMATFHSAVAALDAAAGLQSVARRLGASGTEAGLRIGISTGDLVPEVGDWLGAAAIEASRLCADADGGHTLVAEVTVHLAGTRSGQHLRPVGERVLRGFDRPIRVHELASDESTLLPAAIDRAAGQTLVGRRAAIDRMTEVLDITESGGATAAVIVGEPGIGKTSLAAAAATQGASRGMTVLFGRCEEGVAPPYQPVVDALRPWLAGVPSVLLDRLPERARAPLGLLWPEIEDRPATVPHLEPESQRWELFEAVVTLARVIADERPLLLVIDDLHWAEPSTRMLLAHLVRAGISGFALLATARRDGSADLVSLLGDASTARVVELIELDGLAPDEVSELVADRVGAAPPEELTVTLHRQTDGNPFFLGSLLAHLDKASPVRRADGSWLTPAELVATGVPAGVRAVIDRRLRSLDSGARRALDVAAVCGLSFEEPIVTAVLGDTVDDGVRALDAAAAAGLVREEQARHYAFAHALVRHGVLDQLSRTRLALLHTRIGEELERRDHGHSRLGEIAEHIVAGSGDPAAIVRTSGAAGDEASRRYAFDEAVAHYRNAMRAMDRAPNDPERRYHVLTSLGASLNALGEYSDPLWMEASTIAEELGDPQRIFDAVVGYDFVVRLSEEAEVIRLLEVVRRLAGPGDSPLAAQAEAWHGVHLFRQAPDPDARGRIDEAVAMARRTGNTPALISTLRARLAVLGQGPDTDAALLDATELDALPVAESSRWAVAPRDLVRTLIRLGRIGEANARLTSSVLEAERIGSRNALNTAIMHQAAIATATGDFAEGRRLAADAGKLLARGSAIWKLAYGAQVAANRYEVGRLDDVIAGLRSIGDDAPALDPWRALLANALVERGDEEEAQHLLHQLVERVSHGFEHLYGGPVAVRYIPELCRRLGDQRARQLLSHVQPWSGILLVVNTSIEGAADRSIGHLLSTIGRYDDADSFYTRAAELERSAGFPPLLARTEFWHARMLLERHAPGDRDRAAALLDEVIEITSHLGMELLRRQATELTLAA